MRLRGKQGELCKSIEIFFHNDIYYQQIKPQKQGERDRTHLLDLLRTRLLGHLQSSGKTRRWPCRKMCRQDQAWQSYGNVKELKAAKIQLKRGNNSYLRNVSFTRRRFYPRYRCLPPIIMDDSTGPIFMNFIAYEMCLDFENDFDITSYISFLDSLIHEANDIKELSKARVLHNFLGSDQEVADSFNEIGTDLVPNAEAYKDVKCQIQDYYAHSWRKWMAKSFHDYFFSPWTIITLVFTIAFSLFLSVA
jgi:hypothetical protein